MYKKYAFGVLFCCAWMSFSCQKHDANQAFATLSDRFIQLYLQTQPHVGVAAGMHQYDGKVGEFSKESLNVYKKELFTLAEKCKTIDSLRLSDENKIDFLLLKNQLQHQLFEIDELHRYARPLTYLAIVDVSPYLKRNYDPLEQRLEAVLQVERQIPSVLAQAKLHVGRHNFQEEVVLAIQAFGSVADYHERQLPKVFTKVYKQKLQKDLIAQNQIVTNALRDFVQFLQKDVLPNAHAPYALGRDKFVNLLRWNEGIIVNPDSLLALGMARLAAEQRAFSEAAQLINPTISPKQVFSQLQAAHPSAQQLVETAKQICEESRRFISQNQMVRLPSDESVKILQTPRQLAGATAAMDVPGVFEDPKISEAYYYITVPQTTWHPAQQEAWLRMFNRYTLAMVSIHETYPGHFVQFLYLKKSNISPLRKLFSSYAFVEGWAHYTEQMMWEEGYGGTNPVVRAKYRMVQLAESMLRLCRMVVAIQQHTHGWTVEQSTRFIMTNAFYEFMPAREEAIRGTYDPAYLSYALGKIQLLSLRELYRKKKGKGFVIREFHEKILTQGTLPFSLLQKIILP